MGKNLDPNIKPEKQHANPIKGSIEKPCIGHGGAGLRRKRPDPINQTSIQPPDLPQKIPGETKIETRKTNHVNSTDSMHSISNVDEGMTYTRPLIPDVLLHPGPTYRSPPKTIRSNVPRIQESSQSSPGLEYTSSDINLDFEENSPFQEGVISETYQRPDKLFFKKPWKLNELINTGNLIQIFLNKTSRHRQNTEGDSKKSP